MSGRPTVFALVGGTFLPWFTVSFSVPLGRRGFDVRSFTSSVPMRPKLGEARILVVHVCHDGQFLETVRDLAQITAGALPIVVLMDCPRRKLPPLKGVYPLHKPYAPAAVVNMVVQLIS